jgi:hypothetical protein
VALLLATAIKPHERKPKRELSNTSQHFMAAGSQAFCDPEVGAQQLLSLDQRIERSRVNSVLS